jgi:hypothetical protein
MQLPKILCTIVIHNIRKLQEEEKLNLLDQTYSLRNEQYWDGVAPLMSKTLHQSVANDKALADHSVPSAEEEWLRVFESFLNSPTSPIYEGYCDDPRNTDDAWVETSVYHTHLPDYLGRLLDISDDASCWQPSADSPLFPFRWIDVDSGVAEYQRLYASHFDFVELCVPYCACGRRKYDQDDGSHLHQPVPEREKLTGSCVADGRQPSEGTEQVQQSQHLDIETSDLKTRSRTGMCGEIHFLGNGTPSHYVRARIDKDEDMMHALHLLEMNGLTPPDSLISVTGGLRYFEMDGPTVEMDGPTVDSIFPGIVQAAVKTGACIIDDGYDSGVIKLLGEAVVRGGESVDLIGLTGWGSCKGREYTDKGPADKAFYSKAHANWLVRAGLDPNHSHFLLIDNCTGGCFRTEIAARNKLESMLQDRKGFDNFKMKVERAFKHLNLQSSGTDESAQTNFVRENVIKDLHGDLKHLLDPSHKHIEKGETATECNMGVDELILLHQYASSISAGEKLRNAVEAILGDILQQANKGCNIPLREIVDIRKHLGRYSNADRHGGKQLDSESIDAAAYSGAEGDKAGGIVQLTVPHCGKCEGLYHDNYMQIKFRSSIPRTEYDEWFSIQTQLNSLQRTLHPITCNSCHARLSIEEVKEERFHQCSNSGCDHYFFRSRLVEISRSRDHIVCDGCLSRKNVDAVFGKFVPAVLVVVEGGKGTIHTVASTNSAFENEPEKSATMLQSKKRCTPILVVDGSGRAADFIASTWRHMHQGERRCHGYKKSSCIASVRRFEKSPGKSGLLEASCPFVDAEYRRIFGEGISENAEDAAESEKERNLLVSWVIETCRRKEAVTIYNPFESSKGIDFAIMRAICKGTLCDGHPLSMREQFRLAMHWNLDDKQVYFTELSSRYADISFICASYASQVPLPHVQGTTALEVQREILADHAADTSSAARNLCAQVLYEALENNSRTSVQLLLESGITLRNRDADLKGLYPRDRGQLLNDATAVPTALYIYMTSQAVKGPTIKVVIQDYKLGNFPEEILTVLGIKQAPRRNSHTKVNRFQLFVIAEHKDFGGKS